MEFNSAISLTCCVCMNINAIARTHTKRPWGLLAAICVLRPVLRPVLRHAAKYAAGRSTQIAALRPHSFSCMYPQSDICSHTRTRSTQVIDLSADDMSANFDNLHKIINDTNSLDYHNLIIKIIVRLFHN